MRACAAGLRTASAGDLVIALLAAGGSKHSSSTSPGGGYGGIGSGGGGAGGGGGNTASNTPFDSGFPSAPATFAHVFPAVGTTGHHCDFHASFGLVGTVTVSAAHTGSDSAVVNASGMRFTPTAVTIQPGGYVRWVIADGTHPNQQLNAIVHGLAAW